jgi:UTP--glucose-1-phosphate uridylyltransferase
MILDQKFINVLKETKLGKGNELWVTDAIKTYVKEGGIFLAKKVEDGEWLTTGDPLNYLKATLQYAFERKDIGKDLKEYARGLLCNS